MASDKRTRNFVTTSTENYYGKLQAVFPKLVEDLTSSPELQDAPTVNARLKHLLDYTVATKRLSRGIVLATACEHFINDEMTPEKEFLSYIMAWCLEIVEVGFEIVDDMIDGSEMRRGSQSWHLIVNNGPLACNDAWLLHSCAHALLKKYFGKMAYYRDLYDLFQDVIMKCIYGQTMDALSAGTKSVFKTSSLEQYFILCKYKAGYLACYLPIKAAMLMCGIKEPDVSGEILRDICFTLGHMFQIHDDYVDVFGGKDEIGSDIAEGKVTWVLLTALQLATEDQRAIILEYYGRNDPKKVLQCKRLFESMGIQEIYRVQEKEIMERANSMLKCLPQEISREPFYAVQKMISEKKF